MAAPVIKLRRSAVEGAIPTTSQLALGELAINTFDGKLFIKKNNGTESIVEIGTGGGSALTVKEVISEGDRTANVTVSNVSEIQFNNSSGFNVTDDGNGTAFVDLGSTFNPWQLGQTGTGVVSGGTLSASGEEPIQFIAGNNVTITSNPNATPKTITFSAAGGSGTPGGTDTQIQFNDGGSVLGGDAGLTYNKISNSLNVQGSITLGTSGINSIFSAIDINSWEYGGVSLLVSGQETTPNDIYFKDDGTKMFILGDSGNDVNEYALSTAWEVDTATFTTVFSVAGQETVPTGLFFKPDGTRMYICGQTGVSPTGDYARSYTLSTPWDISTASYDSILFNVGAQDTAPQGIYLSDDGSKMYIAGSTNDRLYEYSLGTNWDVSTATFTTFINVGASNTLNLPLSITAPTGIDFNSSGTKMYISGSGRDIVTRFDLSTPWDISTATFFDNVYVGFQELAPAGVYYQEDQSKAYIVGTSADRVFQYNTDVPSLELASSGISTRSSVIINNEARLNNRLYVTNDAHFSSATIIKGALTVDSTAKVAGTLTLTGGVTASTTTGTINFGTSQTTGTLILGGTSQTGTITLGRSTATHTINIDSGATVSGKTKTINLGTGGASDSTTTINIGPISGTGTITIETGTSLGIGATPTEKLDVNGNIKTNNSVLISDSQLKTTTTTRTSSSVQFTADSFVAASYRTTKYLIEVRETSTSNFYSSEVLLMHDGTDVYITEYGTLKTASSPVSSIDADLNSGNVRLLITPSVSNTITKIYRISLTS